jgi:hypothetical protein
MRNFIRAAVLAAVAMPLAQAAHANDAYWTNKDGKIITSAKTGMCIRTQRWSESKADRACLEKAKKEMMSMRK